MPTTLKTPQRLALEQTHTTLLLKGWERTGNRSYCKRQGNGYVIATAGCSVVVQAMPGWSPYAGRRMLAPDVMALVVYLIEVFEAQQ